MNGELLRLMSITTRTLQEGKRVLERLRPQMQLEGELIERSRENIAASRVAMRRAGHGDGLVSRRS